MSARITVAIVIPFFQREAGVLAGCLQSIAGQQVGDDVVFDVVIVDDGSPVSPNEDIAAAPMLGRHAVRVVRQPNGGVAAARNRGLDSVAAETDFVALIDSDDRWGETHIATALDALGQNNDFYFCDSQYEPGKTLFGIVPFFSGAPIDASYRHQDGDVFVIDAPRAAYFMIDDYLAHTSAVVYRWAPFATLRFEAELRYGGEDHLMWVKMAHRSRGTCFSRSINSFRGDGGISMYRGIDERVSGRNLRKEAARARAFSLMAAEPSLDKQAQQLARVQAAVQRQEIAGILMRPAGLRAALEPETRGVLGRFEHGFWPKLPLRWLRLAAGKARG